MSEFLFWLMHGFTDSGWIVITLYTLIMVQVTILAVTIYLHRFAAHRALELHSWVQQFFRFWLWLTTGMITREWVAVHRKHHAACETEEDPHSPRIKGLKQILFFGVEEYRMEANCKQTIERYGSDISNDWIEKHLYRSHPVLGLGFLLLVNFILFGILGLTVWALQMIWIPFWAAGVINGVGHTWGYRNFESHDASTNIFPFGFFIGGEELHNNHHAYPNSAKFSRKAWELDLGWVWIRIFQALGLARVRSSGPIAWKVPGKAMMDKDSARAIFNDRMEVMANYSQKVVLPLLKEEWKGLKGPTRLTYRGAGRILCRDATLLDDKSQDRILEIIGSSVRMKKIYELRVSLQTIWADKFNDMDECLESLLLWCVEAEETGIRALEKFVKELRSYSLVQGAG